MARRGEYHLVINDFFAKGYTLDRIGRMLCFVAIKAAYCLEQVPGDPAHCHMAIKSRRTANFLRKYFNADYCEPMRESWEDNIEYLRKEGKHSHKAYTSIPGTFTEVDDEEMAVLRAAIEDAKERKAAADRNRRRRIIHALKKGELSHRAIAKREGVSHTFVSNLAQTLNDGTPKKQQNAAHISATVATDTKKRKTITFPTAAESAANVLAVRVCGASQAPAPRVRISNNGRLMAIDRHPTSHQTPPAPTQYTRSTGVLSFGTLVGLSTSAPSRMATPQDRQEVESCPQGHATAWTRLLKQQQQKVCA